MNLTIKNIYVNLLRGLSIKYVLFSYICSEFIRTIHTCTKISFPFLVYPGRGFFYCHGAYLFSFMFKVRCFAVPQKTSVAFFRFRVSESGITGKSVFLAFQTQKESPNFRPYGLLDQANNLLRLLGGVRSTDDDEQSSRPFRGFGGFSSLLLNLNNTKMEFKPPTKLPEANMQAELYRQLTNRGIRCFLEYPMIKAGYGKLRADCIIMDKRELNILAAIEVKTFKNPKAEPSKKNKQRERYRAFYEGAGVKFFYVWNLKTIYQIIDWIKEIYPKYWMQESTKSRVFEVVKEYSDWNDILLNKLEMINSTIIDEKIRKFIKDMNEKASFNIPITKKQANYIHILFDKKNLRTLTRKGNLL